MLKNVHKIEVSLAERFPKKTKKINLVQKLHLPTIVVDKSAKYFVNILVIVEIEAWPF